jgi:hypothetical protein
LLSVLVCAAPALAQGDPESAYRVFHQNVLGSFNPPLWIAQLPEAKRQQFERDTQASLRWVNAVQFMKDEMPRTYHVTSKEPGAGGRLMRLKTTGVGRDFFGKPQELVGVIDLVEERGTWKITEVTWGKRKLP